MIRLGLGIALILLAGRAVAAPVTLAVVAQGPLPGFAPAAVAPYLATRMEATYLAGWQFVAGEPAPDRIEWRFTLDPFAGGAVRQYFPQAQVQHLFGARHRISAELVLYRGGQYQTTLFGQATIQGGAADPDLSDFVKGLTQQMLGEGGALDAIDAGARR